MSYDAIVLGGGSTGASILYYLVQKGLENVALFERSCMACGQTGYSSAIIRTQYSNDETRKMAIFSWRFFGERINKETDCKEKVFYKIGIAYGAGSDQSEEVKRVASKLKEEGINIKVYDPNDFSEEIYRINIDNLEVVTWEPGGGYGDPHTFVNCLANFARVHGAIIKDGAKVVGLELEGKNIKGIRLEGGEVVKASFVVNALNVWSNELLGKYGLELPLTIGREDVVVFEHKGEKAGPAWADLVLGFYSRMEGPESTLVGGLEPEYSKNIVSLEPNYYDPIPIELILKRGVASNRFSYILDSRPRAAWYGFYDISPDWQPILGEDHRVEGLIHAVGLSGHGFKLSPSIGHVISDIIIKGHTDIVDANRYSLKRFLEGRSERSGFKHAILG